MKMYYVYILTNFTKTVLYVGVTNDLVCRIYEHKQELLEGFTKRYHCTKLVYFESFPNIENAITSEKIIKGWTRKKKIALIESINPNWNDLYKKILH